MTEIIKKDFNIYALVVVKNEGDIIYDTITAAAQWANKVFVMDNMSTDDTWEKLQGLEKEIENVVLWGRYGGNFNEGLRQILYREYKQLASDNDWWCRLDGDEFYIDDPREFISALPKKVDHIYNASFQYYFTENDYYREISSIECDSDKSFKRLEWYKCNHSEIRFVKNKKTICWTQGEGWPCNLLNAASIRIRLKHFQYRNLKQISDRFHIRSEKLSGDTFKHEIVSDISWYKRRGFTFPDNDIFVNYKIVKSSDLIRGSHYVYSDEQLPKIVCASMKKYLKCFFVYFYMVFFNRLFFNI